MACVTMKRPVEVLGSPHAVENEPMSKRQRCGPSLFPTTPPSCNLTQDSDSFRGNFHYGSPVSINRGIKRAKRKLDVDDHYSSPSNSRNPLSPFLGATPQLQTGKSLLPPSVFTSLSLSHTIPFHYLVYSLALSFCQFLYPF